MRARPEDYPPGSPVRAQLEAAIAATAGVDDRLAARLGVPRTDVSGDRRISRPEQDLQIALVAYADLWTLPVGRNWPAELRRSKVGEWLYHPANGGARTPVEGAIFKAMGVRAGVADLVLWLGVVKASGRPYPGLYIEVKAPGGKARESQVAFAVRARRVGWHTALVDSIEGFQAVVTSYLDDSLPLYWDERG